MIGRNRQLANQLDAALEGRAMSVPDDLMPLLAAADQLRAAARRIEPDQSLARRRIDRALRPEGRVAQLPKSEPRWRVRLVATGITAAAAVIPATVASTSSVPGDPLYPLKRGIEQVRVIAATSPEAEAAARTDIAYARLEELDALLKSGEFDRVPQVLMDLNTAMGEARQAVAIARQEGADSTQVAAIESQLADVNPGEHLSTAMETLPPEQVQELQDVLETVPPPTTAPPPPTTVPPKGGDGRGSDEVGPTPTSAPTTTTSGTGGEPSPSTAPTTTTQPPTTTEAPTTTTTTTQPPDASSSPSAASV